MLVVLSDIIMPDIGGIELNDRLKSRGISLPVILITGFASVSLTVRVMGNGVFDLIEKPFDNQILLATIQKAFSMNLRQHEVHG